MSFFGKGSIRADGRKIHPAYLFEVKKPADSKYPWDYYNLVATIPAAEAFIPSRQSVTWISGIAHVPDLVRPKVRGR